MTAWARLTWQAADPAALAMELDHRLGMRAEVGGLRAGARVMRLGDADLDLVPWRREAPDDDPRAGGRLVFEPVELLTGADAGGSDSNGTNPAMRLAGVGWATVELDRAEAELDPWLGLAVARGDGTEPHLGARTRTRRSMGLPGRLLVLAEPVTEGRLAASLVRDGEGPCALYLEPVDGLEAWLGAAILRGVPVSAIRSGPLGPSVLIAGVPSGPHLVVVAGPEIASSVPPGSTIAP